MTWTATASAVNALDPASLVGVMLQGATEGSSAVEQSAAENLAARPLMERLAAITISTPAGEVLALRDRAEQWLAENPPGQPVAIEPRGCPIPGACACVQPAVTS